MLGQLNVFDLYLVTGAIEKLICSVNTFKDNTSISKHELESLQLGGLLSHCSHVVDGGRTHSRRFYDLYKIILNNNLKIDQTRFSRKGRPEMVGKFRKNLLMVKRKLSTLNMSSPLYQTLRSRVSPYTRGKNGLRVRGTTP